VHRACSIEHCRYRWGGLAENPNAHSRAGLAAVEITATHPEGPDLHLKVGEARIVQDLPGLELVK
jgi:hypothetical protein